MLTIALFVYNRPLHTDNTLSSLKSANNADMCNIYIYSDGARSESDVTKVQEVRKVCRAVTGFASVNIVERNENFGLAKNIINGVSELFEKFDRVVVLEDDLLVSNDFIDYMSESLSFYEDKGVFSISAYTPNVSIPDEYNSSTYIIPRTCSWGWGTWKSKWKMVDWSISDFNDFISSKEQRTKFNTAGDDLSPMLFKQYLGYINSWSIRFTYAAFKCNEPTVYPIKSLIINKGVDGSGTNMRSSKRYDTTHADRIDCSSFVDDISINRALLISFRKFYNTSLIRKCINYFKLYKYLLLKQKHS